MKDQRVFFVREINNSINRPLIDVQLLEKYKQTNHNCLIQEFHKIFNTKSSESKLSLIQKIGTFLAINSNLTFETLCKRLQSAKKTQFSKLMTEVLMPDQSARQLLEKIRKQMIILLRKTGKVPTSELRLFKLLYETLYCFSSNQEDETLIDWSEDNINIKTTLISLKKMMGVAQKAKSSKRAKQDTYSINLDVRSIIFSIGQSLKGTNEGAKVLQLLEESENKKWLGPRLYKIVERKHWNYPITKSFMDALRKINVDNEELRSRPEIINKVLKKIVINLRKYCRAVFKNEQKMQKKLQKKQKNTESKFFNQNLFLPQQTEVTKKIVHNERNDGSLVEFDFEQFLIKSDEGTFFQKLNQGNHRQPFSK